MTHSSAHPRAASGSAALGSRLRDLGFVVVRCDEDGALERGRTRDWLHDLLTGSPLFETALKRVLAEWRGEDDGAAVEVLGGLWAVPMSLNARRRRHRGFTVAVMATEAILDSEHLAALCQAAEMDSQLCTRLLTQLPLASTSEVPRLAGLIRVVHQDLFELESNRHAVEDFGQQLAESYEEINLLYTVIRNMSVVQQPDKFISVAVEELLATLPYAWVGALMSDDRHRLKRLAGRFVTAGRPQQSAAELRETTARLLERAKPDAPFVLQPGVDPQHAEFRALGRTVLVHPVTSDNHVIGLLIAGDKQGADAGASSVDQKLLGATASHLAIFLKNVALYEDLNTMFLGTVEALTASIDAKDRYTCGHSRRVAELTRQLAIAIGLDEQTVERMHIAGLVHDVGKIGVPERVLLKPGRLTEEEFDWIRRHPEMGDRILRDIPQLKDIMPGVLYHHERWDGNGYPAGLVESEIPLVARLIALADSFDAMSSSRTYRSALQRDEVFEEIRRSAGTQFDPELAPVFITLDFSTYDRLVIEHQANDLSEAGREGQAA